MSGVSGARLTRLFPAVRNILSRSYAEAAAPARAANQMEFTLACPANAYYNAATHVRQVDVSSFSGSFGILPNHVPVLAVIKPGVITVHEEGGATRKFFASSGQISVNDDGSVQVLAEEAVELEELDTNVAKEHLAEAQRDVASAATDEDRVEAMVRAEVYESVIKGVETGL